MKYLFLQNIILVIIAWAGCNPENRSTDPANPVEVKESIIKENREFVKEEDERIDKYIKRHKLDMIKTSTGLRYQVYKKGEGEQAKTGQWARVNYTVKLLDGTEVYSTGEKGPESFLIGQDNVESGLHEGITYMHVGDKARFILPSHLAHGLTGDQDKIPPRSTIIYDVELLSLK